MEDRHKVGNIVLYKFLSCKTNCEILSKLPYGFYDIKVNDKIKKVHGSYLQKI